MAHWHPRFAVAWLSFGTETGKVVVLSGPVERDRGRVRLRCLAPSVPALLGWRARIADRHLGGGGRVRLRGAAAGRAPSRRPPNTARPRRGSLPSRPECAWIRPSASSSASRSPAPALPSRPPGERTDPRAHLGAHRARLLSAGPGQDRVGEGHGHPSSPGRQRTDELLPAIRDQLDMMNETIDSLLALKRQDSGRRSIDRDRRIVLSREGCGQPREQISVVWNGEGEASRIHACKPIRTLVRVNRRDGRA